MHRQPDRGFVRRRPGHAVLLVRRDVEVVSGAHLNRTVLELDLGSSLQHQHPLAGWLVVPEAIGRLMVVGDDPLDAYSPGLQERREEFLGQVAMVCLARLPPAGGWAHKPESAVWRLLGWGLSQHRK